MLLRFNLFLFLMLLGLIGNNVIKINVCSRRDNNNGEDNRFLNPTIDDPAPCMHRTLRDTPCISY